MSNEEFNIRTWTFKLSRSCRNFAALSLVFVISFDPFFWVWGLNLASLQYSRPVPQRSVNITNAMKIVNLMLKKDITDVKPLINRGLECVITIEE